MPLQQQQLQQQQRTQPNSSLRTPKKLHPPVPSTRQLPTPLCACRKWSPGTRGPAVQRRHRAPRAPSAEFNPNYSPRRHHAVREWSPTGRDDGID
ncbi:unnamed protein product [Lampetra planeri]